MDAASAGSMTSSRAVLSRLWRSGSAVLVGSQAVKFLLQMAGLVVLSRLLSPAAFGLVAMATAFTGLASIVGDFGLSLAALTSGSIDQNQRSKLFFTNVAVGTALAVAVAAAGPALAAFYGHRALVGVAAGLAPTFLLNAAAVQFKVELNLSSRWGRLAASEVIGPAAGLVAAIAVAVITPTYWSLVVQPVGAALVQLVLAARLSGWRPSRMDGSSGVRRHLTFGRDTLGLQVINYVSSNVDNVVVGHTAGTAELGDYSRAYQLAVLPSLQLAAPLTRVVLPRLSSARGTPEFDRVAASFQRYLCWATIAPLSLAIGVASPLVATCFGQTWMGVVELLQILCVGSCFVGLCYIYYWSFLALGSTGLFLLTEGLCRAVMIAAILVAARWGTVDVAWAVTSGQLLLFIGSTAVAWTRLDLDVARMLRLAWGPSVVCAAAAAAASIAQPTVGGSSAVALGIGLCVWVAAAALVGAGIPSVRSDARILARRIRRGLTAGGTSEG